MSKPPISSFYASIFFRARMNPHAIAVSYGARTITYGAFCVHIEKVTRRLHSLALPASGRIAVQVQGSYLKWLVVIALARLGMPSASVAGGAKELDLLAPTAVITDKPAEFEGRKVIALDDTWLDKSAGSLPPFRDRLHDPDDPCRIVLSSGTTGMPRKAVLTYGQIEARYHGGAPYGLHAGTRLMVTLGISTSIGFGTPISCWTAGATVVLAAPRPGQPAAHLLHASPTVLFMSPAQLGSLVDQLPPGFQPLPDLTVYVFGSALPGVLSRKTRLRLTQSLFMTYGSAEAGLVTMAHAASADGKPGVTGYLLPPAQLEIVDEQGGVLPNGSAGEVRIRTAGLVTRYLDEDKNDNLRDGWFYPGDLGTLGDDGAFSVVGRTSELMNFGGVKVAPGSVEQALARVPGVIDMAVFSIAGADGAVRPHVAVVPTSEFSDKVLGKLYAATFPRLPAIRIMRVKAIPRNEMGKILRAQLAAAVAKPAASVAKAA